MLANDERVHRGVSHTPMVLLLRRYKGLDGGPGDSDVIKSFFDRYPLDGPDVDVRAELLAEAFPAVAEEWRNEKRGATG